MQVILSLSFTLFLFIFVTLCVFALLRFPLFTYRSPPPPPVSLAFPVLYLALSGALFGRCCTAGWHADSSAGNRCVVLYSAVRACAHCIKNKGVHSVFWLGSYTSVPLCVMLLYLFIFFYTFLTVLCWTHCWFCLVCSQVWDSRTLSTSCPSHCSAGR